MILIEGAGRHQGDAWSETHWGGFWVETNALLGTIPTKRKSQRLFAEGIVADEAESTAEATKVPEGSSREKWTRRRRSVPLKHLWLQVHWTHSPVLLWCIQEDNDDAVVVAVAAVVPVVEVVGAAPPGVQSAADA